ncbi:MAG: bifunctional 2-polyprenyl-6-hydroxyphenol methylase/3-demethylubiquinol 3-O-methyltransferase UbiG [Pseudomonadota bacterium]
MSNTRNKLTIYDEFADRWWSDEVRWVRTLKNMVPGRLRHFDQSLNWSDQKVLDLGCAGGFMAEALDDRGASVVGIDPAADAIRAARSHSRAAGRNIHYDVGVGEALPYPNEQFDAVVCVDVLEHVKDLTSVISEVSRVLKPGGRFCFDTINRNPLASFVAITIAEDLLRILPKGTHDPQMFIKPKELLSQFASAGLKSGQITGLGPRGINRRGDLLFGPLPFTAIIYMGVARKTPM